MGAPVLSTYRVQLRGPDSGFGFTFADAQNLLDYLDRLGITHVYLSPILTPVRGSSHGYDVADPSTVSAELGGPEGLARLSEAARERKIGLIVDIVPNHVGVGVPQQNPWWWDVLGHGRSSPYASFFDIDWDLGGGRILLPVLESDSDVAELTVDGDVLRLGDQVFPISPGTGGGTGPEIHARQHYRLVGWRSGRCGYRRYFSISSLAALRQEDRAVFDASHAEVARWFADGLVDGVRIDHLDGLTDPAGYLAWLRRLVGPDAWIVVEKALAVEESLEPGLPVAGTTGYDALREVGGVFIDPAGAPALTALAASAGALYHDKPKVLRDLRTDAATGPLRNELHRLRRSVVAAAGADHPHLDEALTAVLSRLEVYRCDYRGLAAMMPVVLAETEDNAPELATALQLISAAIADGGEPAVRLHQLCGAVTATAFEGFLFYRDATLVSLNEIGGDLRRFGVGAAEFHDRAAARSRWWPQTMTTTSTHDTKRGEDVRARIGVLSQVPQLWAQSVTRWEKMARSPDAATGLFLWQNLFGAWPSNGIVTDEFRSRLRGFTGKAIREAGLCTNWENPASGFEQAVHDWLDTVLDGAVASELTGLVTRLAPHAEAASLGQKLLTLTAPGIPDVYQGTELWEDSLVDPDNRRPVDYEARREALASLQHPKMRVLNAALMARRSRPDSFLRGGYHPVLAAGPATEHLLAFRRGDDVLVAVTRWTARLAETGWGGTALPLPGGEWTDRLTGREWSGRVQAAELFGEFPVALLERSSG